MDLTEARDVQALLSHVLDPHAVDDNDARQAAARLAERSYARLGAGITSAQIEEQWADMSEECGCDQCIRPVETIAVAGGVL